MFLPNKSKYEPFFFLLMFSSWTDRELLFWSWIVFKLNWLVLERIVEHRLQGSQVLLWELSAAWFPLHDKEGFCCLLQYSRLSLCAGLVCVCVSVCLSVCLCLCVCGGGGGGGLGGGRVVKEGEGGGEEELTLGKKVEKWGVGGEGWKQGDEVVGVREEKTTGSWGGYMWSVFRTHCWYNNFWPCGLPWDNRTSWLGVKH